MRDHSLRIVFFGTPLFAAKHLQALINSGFNVVGVVSQPDRPKGRSKTPQPSPVKQVALDFGIEPILQPVKASDVDFIEEVGALNADLFVVVAYGEILRQKVLDLPSMGCINVHASLLPKYRGAAPIQRCLMDGETETGCSVMHMVRKMDAGAVILQEKFDLPVSMTLAELETKLCEQGQQLLVQVLNRYAAGEQLDGIDQDESLVSFAPKILPEDGLIDWRLSAKQIHNQVRGLSPRPGAYCLVEYKGKQLRLKILKSKIDSGEAIFSIPCGKGSLQVLELQLEGKRAMTVEEFFRGSLVSSIKIL